MAKKSGKTKPAARGAKRGVQRTPAPKAKAKRAPAKPKAAKPARSAAPRSNPVRELAKQIVDLTISHNDEAAFAFYADNVESTEMGQPPTTGIEAIKQKFAMWRGMVSESSWTARNVWVDGNTIIVEWDGRVTLAASGKQVNLREIAIHEVANGKIVRERFYYDPSVLQP